MPKLFNPKDLIIRHSIILVLSFFFGLSIIADKPQLQNIEGLLKGWLWNFLFIATIWNGNVALIKFGSIHKLDWETHTKQKIIAALLVALLWPVLIHFLFNLFLFEPILDEPCDLKAKENTNFLIITVTITLLINAIMVAIEFFNHWKKTNLEKEALKRITLSAEFESLKNQINPHFLFNALNTLTHLIDEDPETASKFVQKLSSVYRYLLSQKDKELVSLNEELDFMKSYVFLYQLRFGDNFKVTTHIPENLLHKEIVTLTLQMLLENAIKHNVISKDKPLHIHIEASDSQLCVSNNLQVKTNSIDSNGIGLKNIENRYSFMSDKKVLVTKENGAFKVCVPLI
jgi:two-component system LytT family sensor kinase